MPTPDETRRIRNELSLRGLSPSVRQAAQQDRVTRELARLIEETQKALVQVTYEMKHLRGTIIGRDGNS